MAHFTHNLPGDRTNGTVCTEQLLCWELSHISGASHSGVVLPTKLVWSIVCTFCRVKRQQVWRTSAGHIHNFNIN